MMHAEFPPTRWIFLRGLARESAHWDDFPDLFCERMPNSSVFTVDLPGNGEHWRLRSPRTISETMEFARQETLKFDFNESSPQPPLYLFAISLGGMVALEWLHRHPREIAGAVLVNTSLRGLSPIYKRLSWRAWPAFLKIACMRQTRERELSILELTSELGAKKPELLETRVKAYERRPVSLINLIRQLQAAAAYRPPPNCPAAPMLLMNSLRDRMVDPDCSQVLAGKWNLRLVSHPWAGHDIPVDDPDWIIDEVSDWFGSLRSTAEGHEVRTDL